MNQNYFKKLPKIKKGGVYDAKGNQLETASKKVDAKTTKSTKKEVKDA